MGYPLLPLVNAQQLDDNSNVLSSGTITVYQNGTTTLSNLYRDQDGSNPHSNPLTLNAGGLPTYPIFVSGAFNYDILVKNSAGVTIRSYTKIAPNAANNTIMPSGFTVDYTIANLASNQVGYQLSGGTARTVLSKLGDSISVKDFGAVGNGITNDTTAVQNAINYGFTNSKAVFFPAGTYLVTELNAMSKDNLRLFGEGSASIIKNSLTTTDTLSMSGMYQTVENLQFARSAVATTGRDISLYGTAKSILRNLTWGSSYQTNYCITNYGSIDDLTIDNCLLAASQTSISIPNSIACNNYTIQNCTFRTLSNSAISSPNSSTSSKYKIINNLFDFSMASAGSSNGTVYFRSLTNSLISNNIFEDAQAGAVGGNQYALHLEGVGTSGSTLISNNIISNNIFSNNPKGAIRIYGDSATYKTTGISITNNQFSGNTTSVTISNYVDTVIIANNVSTDTTFLADSSISPSNVLWKRENTAVRLSSTGVFANATGDGTWFTVPFNRVDFCEDSSLTGGYAQGATNASGQYVCGATGNYLVSSVITLTGATAGPNVVGIRILVNGVTAVASAKNMSTALNFVDISINSVIKLKKNNIVTVQVMTTTSTKNWQVQYHDLTATTGNSCLFTVTLVN